MCTVTYLPLDNNNFILTSNRDETPLRKTLPPNLYEESGVKLYYPKDTVAGGTWIGTSNKKRLVCLLNGGFVSHQRKLPYKMSRGVIVKAILSIIDPYLFIKDFNFDNIEPFTLILVDWSKVLKAYELVWDGEQKHFNKLTKEPKIWSSSTLYTDNMKKERNIWFNNWIKEFNYYEDYNILKFHQNTNLGTIETSPKMKREFVETVSTTTVIKEDYTIFMSYLDYIEATNTMQKKVIIQ